MTERYRHIVEMAEQIISEATTGRLLGDNESKKDKTNRLRRIDSKARYILSKSATELHEVSRLRSIP